MSARSAIITPGESAFDVLQREARAAGIPVEHTGASNVYIRGIGNLREFDCGDLSGWKYRVNGQFPSVGIGGYLLQDGDVVEFVYTCDGGPDVGSGPLF